MSGDTKRSPQKQLLPSRRSAARGLVLEVPMCPQDLRAPSCSPFLLGLLF